MFLAAILLVCAWMRAEAVDRVFSETWDVNSKEPMRLAFGQAESIEYTHRAINKSSPVVLTNAGQTVVWEVMGTGQKYTEAYIVCTGTVQTAAGVVKFFVPPAGANLPPGEYRGFVRTFRGSGGAMEHHEVLARQNITVSWTPDGRFYSFTGPLTYPALYTTEIIASLYLPLPDWRTATNELWAAIGGAVQTELDPAWSAASGAVYQAIAAAAPGYAAVSSAALSAVQPTDAEYTAALSRVRIFVETNANGGVWFYEED
jgi:hypothetical protein